MQRVYPALFGAALLVLLGLFLSESFSQARNYMDARTHEASVRSSPGGVATTTDSSRVVRIVDGDTVDVLLGGVPTRIRLIGVDTPESVDPRRPVECFGKEATEQTRSLLEQRSVRLEYDMTQGKYDKYHRVLAYVFTDDGTFVNLELIRGGYAHEYTYRTPYQYQKQFKQAEQDARTNVRGFWSPEACK